MRKIVYILLLLVVGVGAVSCCSTCRGGKSAPVKGSKWGLTEMNGAVIDRENSMNPDRFTLTLGDDGRVTGMGDCNRFFGPYTLGTDGNINISSIGSTRMMCPNQQMESEFFKMLENAAKYKIDGNFLVLTDAQNKIIGSFKMM